MIRDTSCTLTRPRDGRDLPSWSACHHSECDAENQAMEGLTDTFNRSTGLALMLSVIVLLFALDVDGQTVVQYPAATHAGETTIANAAREPEITDLANCLLAMGAEIDGIGSGTLTVRGKKALHAAEYSVIADRIETGTYAVAAAITGGDVTLAGTQYELFGAVGDILVKTGASVEKTDAGVRIRRDSGPVKGADVMTEPYPGFPTDMQAQIMALLAVSNGASMITETIFENRFMHVPELCRMGADINVHGASAIVRGVKKLSGAQLMATDLRASVSLVLAGLAAKGETVVNRVYHLDRGYERIEEKLAACGARIERMQD